MPASKTLRPPKVRSAIGKGNTSAVKDIVLSRPRPPGKLRTLLERLLQVIANAVLGILHDLVRDLAENAVVLLRELHVRSAHRVVPLALVPLLHGLGKDPHRQRLRRTQYSVSQSTRTSMKPDVEAEVRGPRGGVVDLNHDSRGNVTGADHEVQHPVAIPAGVLRVTRAHHTRIDPPQDAGLGKLLRRGVPVGREDEGEPRAAQRHG